MKHHGGRPLALAFGAVAETYDDVRPAYFAPLLDGAQEGLALGSAACSPTSAPWSRLVPPADQARAELTCVA